MLLAPPPPPPALVGPPAPCIKGLVAVSPAFSATRSSRLALREMPGAVVVVEDDAPTFSLLPTPSMKLARLGLRVFGSPDRPVFPFTPPAPIWMDPNVTMSGGNAVNKVYGFGGGGF